MNTFLLFDNNQTSNVLKLLSRQLYGLVSSAEKLAIIGLLRRGAPLADLIKKHFLEYGYNHEILRFDLKVKHYTDDLVVLHPNVLLTIDDQSFIPNLTGYTAIIIDDVIYTGETALTVIHYLKSKSPANIYLAALVDRLGHKVPIAANVIGKYIQINEHSAIECHVPPFEPRLQIVLSNIPIPVNS